MLTFSFLCHCTLQKAPITASSENLPDSWCMFRSWAKILFLSNRTFQVLIFENIHITKSYVIQFLVNIWDHGKNSQEFTNRPWAANNPCPHPPGGILKVMIFWKLIKMLQNEPCLHSGRWDFKEFWGKILRNLSKIAEIWKNCIILYIYRPIIIIRLKILLMLVLINRWTYH